MDDTFTEAFKLVGSAGGIASAALLILDRIFRHYPIAYLAVSDYWPALVLKNITSETIIIDEIQIEPNMLHARRSNDRISASSEKAQAFWPTGDRDWTSLIILKPDEERRFVLAHKSDDFEKLPGGTQIRIWCRWRNTRFFALWPRHARVFTTVKVLRDMRDAALAGNGR